MLNCVFFVPACGLGERVKALGPKPFLHVMQAGSSWMALDRVVQQAPEDMPVEIALPAHLGSVPLKRDATVYFFKDQTNGQAHTIARWMAVSRMREWVLISNCDNSIDYETIEKALRLVKGTSTSIVFTFTPPNSDDNRYSYVEVNGMNGKVYNVVEKHAISPFACTGVYLLRWTSLWTSLKPTDEYLSAALARMPGLQAMQVKNYTVWGDMAQVSEIQRGVKQFK